MIVFGAAFFVIRPPRTDTRPWTLTPSRERCIHSVMKPAAFRYHAPKTIDEAVALLAEFAAEDGRVLAGGQSLVPTMAFRLAKPAHLIDINGLAALGRLRVAGGRLRVCRRE